MFHVKSNFPSRNLHEGTERLQSRRKVGNPLTTANSVYAKMSVADFGIFTETLSHFGLYIGRLMKSGKANRFLQSSDVDSFNFPQDHDQ